MSNLVLVTEVSDIERGPEEQRPLLGNEDTYCTSSSSQQGDAKVAANYSLIPDASLSAQVRKMVLQGFWGLHSNRQAVDTTNLDHTANSVLPCCVG